jgi:hypothetical protein
VRTIGTAIIALALGRIHRLVDQCIGMEGFVCFRSFGGGAGAGVSGRALLDTFWTAEVELTVKSRQQISMAMVDAYKRQSHPNQPFVRFVAAATTTCFNGRDLDRSATLSSPRPSGCSGGRCRCAFTVVLLLSTPRPACPRPPVEDVRSIS